MTRAIAIVALTVTGFVMLATAVFAQDAPATVGERAAEPSMPDGRRGWAAGICGRSSSKRGCPPWTTTPQRWSGGRMSV